MGGWFKRKWQSDYAQRQIYLMSNLGLFYIIIIALFGVPLIGAFVVVIIKGVLDFQYVILGTGVIVGGLIVFYTGRFLIRLFRRTRNDGFRAFHDARNRAGQGQPVRIEFMGGLLSLSYGDETSGERRLPAPEAPLLLGSPDQDPIRRLKELRDLKTEGVIDQEEFDMLKKKLLDDFRAIPDGPAAD